MLILGSRTALTTSFPTPSILRLSVTNSWPVPFLLYSRPSWPGSRKATSLAMARTFPQTVLRRMAHKSESMSSNLTPHVAAFVTELAARAPAFLSAVEETAKRRPELLCELGEPLIELALAVL